MTYVGPEYVPPVKEQPTKEQPETETDAAQPAAPEPETKAPSQPAAEGSVSQVLNGIKTLAVSDFEGNKDNIVMLLNGIVALLGEENSEAAYLLTSAVQLIGLDAADSDSISLLVDSALDVLVESTPAPAPEPAPEPAAEPETATSEEQGAAGTITQVLEGIKALAVSDFEGNKENIVLLLSGLVATLGEENSEAASLLNSAVQLIGLGAADSDSISLLVDSALEALVDPA